jgi:hypothetical protein
MSSKERALVWLLRVVGGTMLFALPFIFIPTVQMGSIHEWLGLGAFPGASITEYLARSLSAFYAAAGALALFLSTGVTRYRPVILLLSGVTIAFSPVVLWIDIKAGMPASWTWGEGPFVLPLGLVMWWLAMGVSERGDMAEGPPSG